MAPLRHHCEQLHGPDQTDVLDGTDSQDVALTTSNSSRPTAQPKALVSYRWSFKISGDQANALLWMFPSGSHCLATSQGFDTAIASFVADKLGSYTIVLEVTNDLGETANDEVTIQAVLEFEAPAADYDVERLTCFSTPFSDTITFGFTGTGISDAIEVTIFNPAEEQVWHGQVYDDESLAWNGEISEGARAANGAYIAIVIFRGDGIIRTERMLVILLR